MAPAPGITLVLDCFDPEALAPFWASALDYVSGGALGNYVVLVPNQREGPILLLQRVPEDKAGKNRMHLDVQVPDIEAKARQLEHLGARRTGERAEHGMHWVVMADPEGNEFCVCDGGAAGPC
jgi:predicted enzyme related to lactoylglutathione lyase